MESTPINNWVEINERLHLFKIVSASLGGALALMLIYSIYLACRSPLVISSCGNEQFFEMAHRKGVAINEGAIEDFLRKFIHLLYDWKTLNPSDVMKTIAPYSTDGLADRLRAELNERKDKDFKGKTISQGVTNIDFKITDTQVIASFDKVLRINGLPLIIPAEIAFNLVKGSSSFLNPMGLFVNGMVEHEGSKD